MRRVRGGVRSGVLAVVLGAGLVGVVGCGGGEGGSGAGAGAMGLDRVIELSERTQKDAKSGTGTAADCPLPVDVKAAAGDAGLTAPVEPGGRGAGADEPVAEAEGGRSTDPQSFWGGKPGATISCTYHVGADELVVHVIATEQGSALNGLAPAMQFATGSPVDALRADLDKAMKAERGTAVPTAGGNVVTVRLDPGGKGDVALMVTAGEAGKSAVPGDAIRKLAESLAAQL
ncbi:hypothetical protein [Streptomyces sp. NPDC090025]|uniref:hypothetical protein n=1 Tax=Streptomyces sp. NPDC090025 TaxID=3365922 RepID=UPI00383783EE